MKNQILFLEEVAKRVPKNQNATKVMAKCLAISASSVRRKRKGDVPLKMDELLHLSRCFDISIEEVFNPSFFKKRIDYLPTRIQSAEDCKKILVKIRDRLRYLEDREGSWELCSDLPPMFQLMAYPEASAFFLYEGMVNIKPMCFTFDSFFKDLKKAKVFEIQNEIYQRYLRTDSKEIYSLYSFSQLTQKLSTDIHSGKLENEILISVIRMQLEELIQTLEKWTDIGKKKEGSFQLFLSEGFLNNNMILFDAEYQRGFCLLPVKGHGLKLVNDPTVKSALSECMEGYQKLYSCIRSIGEIQRARIFKNFMTNLSIV